MRRLPPPISTTSVSSSPGWPKSRPSTWMSPPKDRSSPTTTSTSQPCPPPPLLSLSLWHKFSLVLLCILSVDLSTLSHVSDRNFDWQRESWMMTFRPYCFWCLPRWIGHGWRSVCYIYLENCYFCGEPLTDIDGSCYTGYRRSTDSFSHVGRSFLWGMPAEYFP